MIFLLFFLSFAQADMTTPPKAVEQQYFWTKNRLTNPGFELGRKFWTDADSKGTLVQGTTTSNSGQNAISFDTSSANQDLMSAAVTVSATNGLSSANIAGSCTFRTATGTSTYTLNITDGSNVLSSSTITSSTTYTRTSVNAVAPASGSIYLIIRAVASNEPAVVIDDCFLGKAEEFNLSQVSQVEFIGSAYIPTTANCVPSRTNTALGAFSTDADCPGPTVEFNPGPGTIQTTDTDLPQFTVNNLPPGYYEIAMSGFVQSADAVTSCVAISDGTTTTGNLCSNDGASGSARFQVLAYFNYTTSANRTFSLFASSATGAVIATTNGNNIRLNFSIKKFPTSSQIGYAADQASWRVDANISGANIDLGTSDQASYVSMTNGSLTMTQNTGSAAVQIPCSSTNPPTGLTCGAGTEDNGVSFTIPKAGDYLACTSFSHFVQNDATGDVPATFQIVETPTNAQTISQEGKSRISSRNGIASSRLTFPHRLCGTFSFASAGQKVLRLMYEQDITATITANQVLADAAATVGQRDIHWEVYPINQQINAPLLVNSVINSSTGVTRIETANLNCDASSAITSQHGSWVSSIGNISAGACAVTLTASMFSSTPYCSVSYASGSFSTGLIVGGVASSTTAVAIDCEDDASTACTAFDVILTCIGAR